jgi:hypothetical protein
MLYNNRNTSGSRYIGIIFNTEGAALGDVARLAVVMIGIFGMWSTEEPGNDPTSVLKITEKY